MIDKPKITIHDNFDMHDKERYDKIERAENGRASSQNEAIM